MTKSRPNLFIMLGLDPSAPWDAALFHRVLQQCAGRWTALATKGVQSTTEVAEAKVYLSLVHDKVVERIMLDPSARETERENARAQNKTALADRRRELERRLDLLAKRGHLLEAEAAAVRGNFGDVLADAPDLAERIDALTVPPASSAARPRLDETSEAQLRDQLKQAEVRSLYEVLKEVDESVTEQSPVELLLAAADKLYRRESLKKKKTDPRIKARERLSGTARKMFRTEEMRRRHDASMRLTALRDLVEWFVEVLGGAKVVSSGQVEWFLEEARNTGVPDLDVALTFLRERLTQQGWAIELPHPEAESRLRRQVPCPQCNRLNEPESTICQTCGFALREPCPCCGRIDPMYGGGCRCGFPIGQRERVKDLLVQALEALDAYLLAQAELHLDRAESIWRLPPNRTDPISDRVRQVRARWAAATGEIEQATTRIDALMRARCFIEATTELRAAPEGLPRRDPLMARAESMVARAREVYDQARRPGTPFARRVALHTEALRLCEDFEAARVELGRIPPDPPFDLRATVSDPAAGVLLTWDAPADPDVSYVVVRRNGTSSPESTEDLPDQKRVGNSAASPFRDESAVQVPGSPLTYAVFAMRSETYSAPAAAPPVVLAVAPTLYCKAGDGQVIVRWETPPHAVRIELTRRTPGTSDPPVALFSDTQHTTDTSVRNGVRYRYSARAAYALPDGLRWSPDHSEEVIPSRPPTPPGPLTLTESTPQFPFYSHKVDFRFPPPERGQVTIVGQAGAGSLRAGDQATEKALPIRGTVLDDPAKGHVYHDRASQLVSYFPVLRVDGMVCVGKPRRYAVRDEVADLHGEFAGRVLRLRWTWPDGSVQVLVAHRAVGEVLDVTVADHPLWVPRTAGEDVGACEFAVGPDDTSVHVTMAVVVQRDGQDFVTAGVRRHLHRPPARVEYEVRARRPALVLRSARPLHLPALVLRGRPDRPPRSREDGVLIATLDPRDLDRPDTIKLPKSAEGLKCRLFTRSLDEAATVELVAL